MNASLAEHAVSGCTRVLSGIKLMAEHLDAYGVEYCHFKSNIRLNETALGRTDLDLLVARGHAAAFATALLSLGFKRVESQSWTSFPGIEDWLGHDAETGRIFHLHVHYQVLTGRRFVKPERVPMECLILKTRIRDASTGLMITHPVVEFALMGIRVALKTRWFDALTLRLRKGRWVPAYVEEELRLLAHARDASVQAELEVSSPALRLITAELARQSLDRPGKLTLSQIRRLKRVVDSALWMHRRLPRLLHVPTYCVGLIRFAFARLLTKLTRKPRIQVGKRSATGGQLIVFLGIDGSGKSSCSEAIARWLRKGKIDAYHTYLGGGKGDIGWLARLGVNLWMRTGRRFIADPAPKKEVWRPPALRKTRNRIVELLRIPFFLLLARGRMKKVAQSFRARANGSVVVTDRYPQYTVHGDLDGPKLTAHLEKPGLLGYLARLERLYIQQAIAVEPDAVFVLEASPERVWKRRYEGDVPAEYVAEYQARAEKLRDVASGFRNVYRINANEPFDEVLARVRNLVWELL